MVEWTHKDNDEDAHAKWAEMHARWEHKLKEQVCEKIKELHFPNASYVQTGGHGKFGDFRLCKKKCVEVKKIVNVHPVENGELMRLVSSVEKKCMKFSRGIEKREDMAKIKYLSTYIYCFKLSHDGDSIILGEQTNKEVIPFEGIWSANNKAMVSMQNNRPMSSMAMGQNNRSMAMPTAPPMPVQQQHEGFLDKFKRGLGFQDQNGGAFDEDNDELYRHKYLKYKTKLDNLTRNNRY